MTVWLQKKKITVLPWPSMSSNLTPIENLWQKLKAWINHQSPKDLQESECITIVEKTCSNFIKNFRKQLQQVIKVWGHVNDYLYHENWIFSIFHIVWIIFLFLFCLFFFSYLVNLTYLSQNWVFLFLFCCWYNKKVLHHTYNKF